MNRFWARLFLLLFPLAYLGGVLLELAEERPARVEGALDRAMSIKEAQKFAASKGVSVEGWTPYVVVETHDDLVKYYASRQNADLATLSRLVPARAITVLLRSPDQKTDFRTYLSLTGDVTGFDSGKVFSAADTNIMVGLVTVSSTNSQFSKPTTADDKKAEAIAEDFVAKNAALTSVVKLGPPTRVDSNADDSARTEVTWAVSPEQEKELTLRIVVAVRDGRIVAQQITGKLNGDFAKEDLPKSSKFPLLLNSIYGVFMTFSVLYAIVRYAKRTFQKEVSHTRTLIVAAVFFVSYSIYVYSLAVDQVAVRVSAGKFASISLTACFAAALSFAVMGLLVGIAYGSGEGEVREAYPGKLTSLDALLAGRIFSRDVSASILWGAAAAGWLLLCQHALGYFLPTDMMGARAEGLNYTFARLPWLSLLLGRQYASLLIAVAGLLLPASFLLRSKSRGYRSYIWLLLFALCSVMHDAASYPTPAASLLAMAVLVTALLLPFFAFDLLAAIVSLSSLAFVNELARLSAVFPSWIEFAFWLGGFATVTLAVATYLTFRGESVSEEEVRPVYAKNLAERMGLQAEVQAAREAQLRLLPQTAPQVPGIEFAACCLPAKGVGGDFYDFFPVDANRIGVFVAQGSERGLASALRVALAKGILMHASQQSRSAAQIVQQLEESMAKLLESKDGTSINFIYGVIDCHRQMLNYARVGDSPRVLVHRRDTGFANATPLERRVNFAGRPETAPAISEGASQLGPGDHLIFFTEGVRALRLKRFGNRPNRWLEVLMSELAKPGEAMQTQLLATLKKYQSRASEDLTAVVLRALGSESVQKEGVA
jgi:serine phosphatase RsbU (regulator of sigma subunit)